MRLKSITTSVFLLLLLIGADRSASAANNQDRVSFGTRIVVGEDETIGDAVCFLCSVESRGKIEGDVVTFLGGVRSTKPIHGDVVSFAGDVTLADDAVIDGDLVIFGGSLQKNGNTRIGGDQVVFPAIIFAIPLLILGAIVWGISTLFRRRTPVFYIPPAR